MSVLTTIGSLIPPPTFLQLPSAGVDISDSSLKYIQFARDRKVGRQLELRYWGDIDIDEGALHRGTVHDQKKLAAAIREVRERTGVQNVRVSLPEERAYLFETEIRKGTPLKEIRGQLEFRLEENVPLSPKDAFFDYDIFDMGKNSPNMQVSVIVYARDTIMSYYDACREAGVIPISFEVEAQAIARASIPRHDPYTHLIVDFGKTRTGIGIVYRGVLMYTSTIDIGGSDLSAAIKKVRGDLSEAQLTDIKNNKGLVPEVHDADVYQALMPVMKNITDEVATRMQYWNSKTHHEVDRQIQSVILCGGSVNMKGLPAYFSEVLGIEAKRADVWQNAFSLNNHVPSIGRRYSFGYATAIGLALAPFQ